MAQEFELDPRISRYMDENGCDELEAANALCFNLDEIYDLVEEEEDE